jgi:hypothetical protein
MKPADFICFESVLVETKAIAQLTGADRGQVTTLCENLRNLRMKSRSKFVGFSTTLCENVAREI